MLAGCFAFELRGDELALVLHAANGQETTVAFVKCSHIIAAAIKGGAL
jgi:hypothetical protein